MDYDWRNRPSENVDIPSICRELASSSALSERNINVAKCVIQKIFKNKSIDLCSIFPPQTTYNDGCYQSIYELINGYSSFFDMVLEDDRLSNELWDAILEQCDSTMMDSKLSKDSVLMNAVSSYVTRMLPCDDAKNNLTQRSSQTTSQVRKHQICRTPLQLFLPNSPLVNKISIEEKTEMMAPNINLHPRYVNVFCNLVQKTCSTASFPTPNKLLLLRYLLKQFHVFCLFVTGDDYIDTLKMTMMTEAPFQSQLFAFFYTSLVHCPTISSFKDLTNCWLTYCRPWRYYNISDPNDCPTEGVFIPFAECNFDFYRILLGKIIKKFSSFNLNAELMPMLKSVVEFAWKEPHCVILRGIGLDVKHHTTALLDELKTVVINQKEIVEKENMENSGFLKQLLGSSNNKNEETEQLIGELQEIMNECDKRLSTNYMTEIVSACTSNETTNDGKQLSHTCISNIMNDTPKRDLMPDHYIDPKTNLMFLTPTGRKQILQRERRFDVSKYLRKDGRGAPLRYEVAPLVHLLNYFAEKANSFSIVKNLGEHYLDDGLTGHISRILMYPPVPNLDPSAMSPVLTPRMKKSPPMLKLRTLANIPLLVALMFILLTLMFGRWFVIPLLIVTFLSGIIAMAIESDNC